MEWEMATHSSFLAWRIPWTEEPGQLQSMGSQRVRHNWSNLACMHSSTSCILGSLPMSDWPAVPAHLSSFSLSLFCPPQGTLKPSFLSTSIFPSLFFVINWKAHVALRSCVQPYVDFLPTGKMYSEQLVEIIHLIIFPCHVSLDHVKLPLWKVRKIKCQKFHVDFWW